MSHSKCPPAATGTVKLLWITRRQHYVLRWTTAGGHVRQLAAGSNRRAAQRKRIELEDRQPVRHLAWPQCWKTYLAQHDLAKSTIRHARSAQAAFEPTPAVITSAWVAQRQAELRNSLAPATVNSYSKRLRAVFLWSAALGYHAQIRVYVSQDAAACRTRALLTEEFERMAMASSAGVRRILLGLWTSGLRLSELLALSWDRRPVGDWRILDLCHHARRPTLVAPASQKRRVREVIPCAPEFATLLRAVPPAARVGSVFHDRRLGKLMRVGKLISDCGRRAGVLVDPRRTASAHDLRHSFAMRWAERGLSEAELAAILRHRAVATTRQYYQRIDAQRLGDRMLALAGGDRR